MIVLDASAVLALLKDEPGADTVSAALDGALLGTANLAEVMSVVADVGGDGDLERRRLLVAGVTFAPVTELDAGRAGTLRTLTRSSGLSLGDRLCLALTLRTDAATVLTADRAWAAIDLPLTVRLIR